MRSKSYPRRSRGLTLLEVLWLIGAVLLLAALLLPRLASGGPSRMFVCLSNLRQVGIGELVWAHDHSATQLPAVASTNAGGLHETLKTGGLVAYTRACSNLLGSPKVLVCPSDDRRKPAKNFATLAPANISYFLNASADMPNVSIVVHGDRHLQSVPPQSGGRILLATNTTVDWTPERHSGTAGSRGNVSFLDGSAQTLQAGSNTIAIFGAPVHQGHLLLLP